MANQATVRNIAPATSTDSVSLDELHEAVVAAASNDAESVERMLGISFSFAAMFAAIKSAPIKAWFGLGRKMGWIRPVSSMTVAETLSMMASIAMHLAQRAPMPVRLACGGVATAATVYTAYLGYLSYKTKKALEGTKVRALDRQGVHLFTGHVAHFGRHKEEGTPLVEILTNDVEPMAFQVPLEEVQLVCAETGQYFTEKNMKAFADRASARKADVDSLQRAYAEARLFERVAVRKSSDPVTPMHPIFEGLEDIN